MKSNWAVVFINNLSINTAYASKSFHLISHFASHAETWKGSLAIFMT